MPILKDYFERPNYFCFFLYYFNCFIYFKIPVIFLWCFSIFWWCDLHWVDERDPTSLLMRWCILINLLFYNEHSNNYLFFKGKTHNSSFLQESREIYRKLFTFCCTFCWFYFNLFITCFLNSCFRLMPLVIGNRFFGQD